ncbi:hypothetical protein TSMEX_007894 [Taenia solium]|eukprot:TsM_001109600 transcript=TsM_001109600 gene=TsM_001109600
MKFVLVNVYCFGHALNVFSPLPSGVRAAASYARASSECRRHCGSGEGQQWQWQREMRQSSLHVGVTRGVPWKAAATSEKARIGRLNSSRDASAPLPPIPSAGTPSSSGFSKGEYVYLSSFAASEGWAELSWAELGWAGLGWTETESVLGCGFNITYIGSTFAPPGGHRQNSFTCADAASQTPICSLSPPASYPPTPPPSLAAPPSSRHDDSSAHQTTAIVTTVASTSERASSATNFAIAAHPSAVEWVSRPANHLSHTACVPRSHQGCSDYGGSRGHISTISSGQPFIRRNPINDTLQQSSCLPARTLVSSLPAPSPTEVPDAARLTDVQSQR